VLSSAVRPEVHASLPGQWCRALSEEQMMEVVGWLLFAGASVSRLDLAGDDYDKRVMPADVWEAVKAGECVSHTQKRTFTESWKGGGSTVAFGARSGRQYLRVYDKAAESLGQVDAVRWELETKDEAAQSLLVQLMEYAGRWGELFKARLVQFVDFKEVGGSNATRRKRAAWFAELVGAAEKARVYGAVALRTVEKVAAWLEKQVAPSLAVVFQVMGGDLGYLSRVVELGRRRWRSGHHTLLASAGLGIG